MLDTKKIRERILRAACISKHGHIPSSFSVIEAIIAVYSVMRHDPRNPAWSERDLFILSKGHAALGYYSVLSELGYFPPEECETMGTAKSRLGCHADRLKVPGAEASTGSLGHGIGLAAGMALGLKIMGSARKVYVLIGDGEANEGSVWEALLVASDQNLINLTVLYDHNQSQTRCLQIKNPAEKLAAFGCHVHEVNGHSVDEIRRALQAPSDKLKAVVCRTMKGHGCPSLVNDFHAWHCRSPKPEELEVLIKEIYAPAV